jgi:polysaccharide deacetylase 2 family uncharacterized protein YibQ
MAGVGIGYGTGFLLKENPQKPEAVETTTPERKTATPKNNIGQKKAAPRVAVPAREPSPPLLPEDMRMLSGKTPRAYEEALPRNIIETARILPVDEADREKPDEPPAAKVPERSPEKGPPTESPQAPAKEKTETLDAAVPEKPAEPAPKAPAEVATVVPKIGKRPRIVLVLDDLGIDKPRTARAIRLKGPLTLSFLTYASDLGPQTRAAREAGHELLIHIPMEPGSPDVDPGPNVLLSGVPPGELLTSLKWNLDQFSGYVGANNHMGSRFTADLPGMEVVMKELKKRKLFFLDSITAGNSVARKAARKIGVPFAARNVFLDHQDDVAGIQKRLAEVEKLARKNGVAIAIGHPRESTLQALVPWLEKIESKGLRLVPLSQVVKRRP